MISNSASHIISFWHLENINEYLYRGEKGLRKRKERKNKNENSSPSRLGRFWPMLPPSLSRAPASLRSRPTSAHLLARPRCAPLPRCPLGPTRQPRLVSLSCARSFSGLWPPPISPFFLARARGKSPRGGGG
jgi:hypothetical protein